jgi:hypothetical protein
MAGSSASLSVLTNSRFNDIVLPIKLSSDQANQIGKSQTVAIQWLHTTSSALGDI